jgi:hypothetical protein
MKKRPKNFLLIEVEREQTIFCLISNKVSDLDHLKL